MGIFDRFKSKKATETPAVIAEPIVAATAAKKPRAKKKDVTPTELPKKAPAKKKSPAKKKDAEQSDYQAALEKAKAQATAKGEPWVTVLNVEIDMDNLSNGSFMLDWNDYFIAKLVRAGYTGTDTEMVDLWFQSICRNILQENFEQEQADPTNRFRE